jgi:uncharacterized membrane protein YeaQ/YmgE (transglycosylase-associated protein family)
MIDGRGVIAQAGEVSARKAIPLGDKSKYEKGEKEGKMGMLSWIVMGLIVGMLAKFIMPGKDPGGIIVTILIGIAGAFVGGFIGSLVGLGTVTGFNLGSFVLAIGGGLLLLFGYRLLKS